MSALLFCTLTKEPVKASDALKSDKLYLNVKKAHGFPPTLSSLHQLTALLLAHISRLSLPSADFLR